LAPGVPYHGFGTNNTGTRFAGAAGLKDGDVGNPNTPGSCIKIPAQSGIVEEITITCWVKRSGDNMVWRGLVTQRDNDSSAPNGAGNGTGLTLGADGTSPNQGAELRMLWNKGDVWWQWSPQLNTPNRQWAFCAVVFSATNRTIYLNTRQASQTVEAAGAGMPQTPHDWAVNPIFIGYDARGPYYNENSAFNGTMDEVTIFNRALTSNELMQIYAAAEVPPIILVQPQAPPPPVYEGMMLSLSVVADASASASPLAYQWTKNGTPISGQTATNYTVSNLVTNDSGSYAVVITNTYGAVTSSVVALIVKAGPPIFVQKPQPIQRFAGGTAAFTSVAVGSPPLSYQWSFNSTPISGATSSAYILTEVGPGDAGNYSVLVTNPYGNTNSGNATLTLLSATKLAAAVTDLSPLAYWRLDETSGTEDYDYWGGRDGTRTAGATNNADGPSPASTPTPCQGFDAANKAYGLNNGWVSVPPLKLNTDTVMMIAWVNPVDVSGGHHGIVFAKTGQNAPDGCGLDWWSGGLLEYQWNSARRDNPGSGLYVIPGQWNFVALVVEPTQGTIYLDDGNGGGLQSSANPANNGIAQFGGELRLGSDVQDNRNFIGLIDDVAIFNRALSADEIESIRKAGVNGIYAPTALSLGTQPQSQTVIVGSPAGFVATVAGSQPISYQWQKNGVNIPGAIRKSFSIASAYYTDAGNYSLRATNTAGGMGSTNAVLTVMPTPSVAFLTNDLVLHMPFDGTYLDTSGRGNNGTKIGDPTFVAGKVGSNALHDNTDTAAGAYNYVMLGAPTDLSFGSEVSFSVAFWTKFSGLPGDLPWLANNSFSYGGTGVTLAPSYNQGSWSWYLNDATAGDWNGTGLYAPVQNTLNNGAWHHLVYSFDRTGKASVYRDGVLDDQRSITNGAMWNLDTGMTWAIGQAGGSYGETAAFDIDDMGIWRRALSGYEALSIYNAAQAGRSFDVKGPVNLYLNSGGGNFDLSWQTGTLLQSTTVQGPWTPVPGATASFYRTTPAGAAMFYRVRN
jgi:hypothetical protein